MIRRYYLRKEKSMIETDERCITKHKPRKCPNCGSKRIANILYGPSHFYPGLSQEREEGRVILRACCLKGPVPSWECLFCGVDIYKEAGVEGMSLF